MACEVLNPRMGQDQERGIADDPLEAPGPSGVVPADPLIAPPEVPGRPIPRFSVGPWCKERHERGGAGVANGFVSGAGAPDRCGNAPSGTG